MFFVCPWHWVLSSTSFAAWLIVSNPWMLFVRYILVTKRCCIHNLAFVIYICLSWSRALRSRWATSRPHQPPCYFIFWGRGGCTLFAAWLKVYNPWMLFARYILCFRDLHLFMYLTHDHDNCGVIGCSVGDTTWKIANDCTMTRRRRFCTASSAYWHFTCSPRRRYTPSSEPPGSWWTNSILLFVSWWFSYHGVWVQLAKDHPNWRTVCMSDQAPHVT